MHVLLWYRKADMAVYVHTCNSPLGLIRMTSDGQSLTSLKFEDHPMPETSADLPVFEQTEHWLNQYFKGKIPDIDIPVFLPVTPFQNEVLSVISSIPYGTTMTYGQVARRIASKRGIRNMSAQAVGNALAHNPVWLIIPCHRVIGKNGELTGYAGGLERKAFLLKMEQELLFQMTHHLLNNEE